MEMPALNSFGGFLMTVKFVKNWYSLLILYSKMMNSTTIKFRDGEEITISKRDEQYKTKLHGGFAFPPGTLTWLENSVNFDKFYEGLYERYLREKGFSYNNDLVTIDRLGLKIKIFKPYSFVLDEVFVMKVYGEPNLTGRTAIDIGASIGDSSLYLSTRGAEVVYAYELDPDRYNLATQNIEMNKLEEKIKIFNRAANSELVNDLILSKDLSGVFLKLDCEGCEYEVLNGIDKKALERVDDVVMEYHKDPVILMKHLETSGFQVKKKGTLLIGKRS